jgi:protein TonB
VPAQVQISWQKSLISHLNRYKRYPDGARARSHQGIVKVEFTIDRGGRVIAARVIQGSGSQHLDDEALAVLQRASPLPAPPSEITGETLQLAMPIHFRIR